MAEFSLQAEPFLGGFRKNYDTIIIKEVMDLAITSIALPLGGEDKAEKAIKSVLKLNLPQVGASTLSKDGETALLRLGKDQLFCLMEGESDGHAAHKALADKFGDEIFTTDQSDVWINLTLRGPDSLRALERICPIDLHPDKFTVGALARTAMAHLGTIIYRNSEIEYTLMSASSSAVSFLQAVQTSVENVL